MVNKLFRDVINVFNGGVYVFCHTLDDTAAVLAEGFFAVLAELALAASPVGVNGNSVAGPKFGNALANLCNNARNLVTECNRIGYRSCIFLAADLVVIASADTAICDFNANFARGEVLERKVTDSDVAGTV